MPLLGDIRRLFSRTKPVALIDVNTIQTGSLAVHEEPSEDHGALAGGNGIEQNPEPPLIETLPFRMQRDDPAAPQLDEIMSLVRTIGEHVIRHNERAERLLTVLEGLPQALASLPDHARQNAQLLELLSHHARQTEARDASLSAALANLNRTASQQTDVMGLLQQQLDSNAQSEARIIESIDTMPQTLRQVAERSERACELLSDISRSAELRERQFIRSIVRIQYWMIAAVLLCALAAGGALVVSLITTAR
jgi:hypothetical protein